ncbi:hypothetical protein C8A05DRAFT_38248 [Staphylotrichum tortipilum]|uniref:NACHT domain-containing protein n=1 Tax=Staphylotrichum tortipilum TaxID=2831512 RepID=A0AAN6MD87_9PEZI|nr:hypothetical protein C8A05DRAFT_38248 [Staphylotrichum longicolle]
MDATLEYEAQKLTLQEHAPEADETLKTTRDEACPETYNSILATILQQTSEGSGICLVDQDDFMQWMDPADSTCGCLWLCGMPGSGKTYLTANIIRRLQQTNHPTLFAFLSHDQPQTKRDGPSILLSLLFQAVEADPSLKSMIPDPSWPDHATLLDRDYAFLRDSLCSVLLSMKPAFIVLDGLDEVGEAGWREVLGAVMEVKKKCKGVKVLVASRELEGVAGLLGGHGFATLRVDGQNEEDVEEFVRAESHELLLGLERGGAAEGELLAIREVLRSIVDKADGMLLYAKLALHAVNGCKTPTEFQSEIDSLPKGLDQVYGRLISSMEAKATTQNHVEAIRRVLMMAVCAGRPLREQELLQFLGVDTSTNGLAFSRTEHPNIVRDCGPILQVVDGVVRFIHLTAKEYLLREPGNNFPKLADAHLSAALACITYLSSTSLDILFPEPGGAAGITHRMLNGDFVFLTYAVTQYINHIKAWLDHKDPQDSTEAISAALHQLFNIRRNEGFKYPVPSETFLREFYTPEAMADYKHREGFIAKGPFNPEPPETLMSHFSPLGGNPALQRSLACTAAFVDVAKMGMVAVEESDDPSTNDPLTLFSALGEFRRNLEGGFCDDPDHSAACQCQRLEELYGPRRYYCSKLLCSGYLTGFPTKAACDRHVESHARDFKCPVEDCYAVDGGLSSISIRGRHMFCCHSDFNGADNGVGHLRVLHDAIRADDLPTVHTLLADGTVPIPKRHDYLATLSLAARHSSPAILTLLLDPDCSAIYTPPLTLPDLLAQCLTSAIEASNHPAIAHLLTLGADPLRKTFYSCPLDTALAQWDAALLRFLTRTCGVAIPPDHPNVCDTLFSAPHLAGLSVEELRRRFAEITPYLPAAGQGAYALAAVRAVATGSVALVRVGLEVGGDPDGRMVGMPSAVLMAAQMGWVGLVRVLLEHGADPNVLPGYPYSALFETVEKRGGESARVEMVRLFLEHGADPNLGGSPLYMAVQRGRARAVKMLLQHGADPVEAMKGRDVARLEGAGKVEAYFGMSWEEIVRRIQQGEDLEKVEVAR